MVPIRSPKHAKTRLALTIGERERAALVVALIDDILTLAHSCDLARWFVVTDDLQVEKIASSAGIGVIRDAGDGLNEALSGAASYLLDAGFASMVVLPMDLPLATCEDVGRILEVGETSDVVVVPSIGDGGTNALYLSPPDSMRSQFGAKSLLAHVDAAEHKGLRVTVLPIDNLACDLDSADDVTTILRTGHGRTGATLDLLGTLVDQIPE